jgi:hypothetical protein
MTVKIELNPDRRFMNDDLFEIYKTISKKFDVLKFTTEFTSAETLTKIGSSDVMIAINAGGLQPLWMVSSSAQDAVAGTGARSIKITSIDLENSLYIPKTTEIIPTGLTLKTVGNQIIIIGAEVLSAGSGGQAAGNIDIGYKGYQELNLDVTSDLELGIDADTYDINVNLNGGGADNREVTIEEGNTWGDLVTKLNASLAAGTPILATASIVNGKFRVTADNIGTSTIALTAGTSSDLLAELTATPAAAVNGANVMRINADEIYSSALQIPLSPVQQTIISHIKIQNSNGENPVHISIVLNSSASLLLAKRKQKELFFLPSSEKLINQGYLGNVSDFQYITFSDVKMTTGDIYQMEITVFVLRE